MDNNKVNFSYPEGFMEATNSLNFLPEEARAQTLIGLMLSIVIM